MISDKLGRNEVRNAFMVNQLETKKALDNLAAKSYAYYKKDHLEILSYLGQHLGATIKDPSILRRMPIVYLNDIPRIVRRLAMVYKTTPERIYSSEPSEELQAILNKNDKWFKEFHRQAKLLNTIAVRPLWREKYQKFDFLILGRHLANVISEENNHQECRELSYDRMFEIDGEDEIVTLHWTENEYWATDANGNDINPAKLPDILTKDRSNPYGRIPFIFLRLEDDIDDFWGNGLTDIVNLQEANNGKLIDAFYKQYLSFGYPIGTNLDIVADDFEVAPYKPIMVNNQREDMKQADLKFASPDHKVDDDQMLIDWIRKSGANTKNLSGSAMSESPTEMSGYRKALDDLPLYEENNDDMDVLHDFEIQLHEMMQTEAEVMEAGIGIENVHLEEIKYRPYEYPQTVEEIWKRREYEFKYNISSPVDWLKEDRAGLTDDEANEILTQNKATNQSNNQSNKPSIFDKLNESSRQNTPTV